MKNRTLIGLACIVLAAIVVFVIAPTITAMQVATVRAVKVTSDIRQASEITADMVSYVELSQESVPDGAITNIEDIVGKYATSKMFTGDIVTESKVQDSIISTDDAFRSMPDGKVAVSISLGGFAEVLSGKLQAGDIITLLVSDSGGSGYAVIPELKYLEILATTSSEGKDVENVEGEEYVAASTATFIVTPEQAKLLAYYNSSSQMYITLVHRGEDAEKQKYLDEQNEILNNSFSYGTDSSGITSSIDTNTNGNGDANNE